MQPTVIKRLLFLLSVLPIIANGQNIQTSVHAGIARYPDNDVTNPYGSIRVGTELKNFTLGGALDFSFGKERKQFYYTGTTGVTTLYKLQHVTYGISPNIFANYKVPVGKSYFYLGADVGLYYHPVTSYSLVLFPLEEDYLPMRHIRYETNAVFGGQAGYSLSVSKSFGINIEVAARYALAKGDNILYFPVSAGIRYTPAKRAEKEKTEQEIKE